MFRSSTIISELALNLAKIIFMLKYCFNINIILARFCVSSLMVVEDRNM